MILVVETPADPISEAEIQEIRMRRKETHAKQVAIVVSKTGILPYSLRVRLVKQAIAPYRFLTIAHKETPTITLDSSAEAVIRTGDFRGCAFGTRTTLIQENAYLEQIVDARCNPHRAAHSKEVAKVCVDLARAHGLDEAKAYRMGMLHDITKNADDAINQKWIEIYAPDVLPKSPKIYHSYTAVIFLKQMLGITDWKVLYAIAHHTLGDGHSDYARILYIADKCEPTRDWDCEEELRVSRRDLARGFAMVHSESKQYLLEKEGIHA